MASSEHRRTRKRTTIKDVAEHAGVSMSTVSYVLNDSGPVAPDRRTRVLDAVRVLEYSPNESARNLKRRSASRIGMVVPDLTNQFFAMITEGVHQAASARDVLVVLVVPGSSEQSEEAQTRLLRSQRVDGVIYLTSTGSMPEACYELARSGPVVLVDEQIPGIDLPPWSATPAGELARSRNTSSTRATGTLRSSAVRRVCGRLNNDWPATARHLPGQASTRTRSRCTTATTSNRPAGTWPNARWRRRLGPLP